MLLQVHRCHDIRYPFHNAWVETLQLPPGLQLNKEHIGNWNGLTLILQKNADGRSNINKSTPKLTLSCRSLLLHVRRGGGTGDNLNQLTGNGGLTLTVVQDLEPMGLLALEEFARQEKPRTC